MQNQYYLAIVLGCGSGMMVVWRTKTGGKQVEIPAVNPDIILEYAPEHECPWNVTLEYTGGETIKLEPISVFVRLDIVGESLPVKVSLSRIARLFQLDMNAAYIRELQMEATDEA